MSPVFGCQWVPFAEGREEKVRIVLPMKRLCSNEPKHLYKRSRVTLWNISKKCKFYKNIFTYACKVV